MTASEHGTATPDRVVPARVFLGVGAFLLAIAAVYAVTAYEEAGTALLVLASALSLWFGAYLWLGARADGDPDGDDHGGAGDAEAFLPHASPWPFAIGVGAFLLANGLVAGGWFFVPGGAVLLAGVGGFVQESRAR